MVKPLPTGRIALILESSDQLRACLVSVLVHGQVASLSDGLLYALIKRTVAKKTFNELKVYDPTLVDLMIQQPEAVSQ